MHLNIAADCSIEMQNFCNYGEAKVGTKQKDRCFLARLVTQVGVITRGLVKTRLGQGTLLAFGVLGLSALIAPFAVCLAEIPVIGGLLLWVIPTLLNVVRFSALVLLITNITALVCAYRGKEIYSFPDSLNETQVAARRFSLLSNILKDDRYVNLLHQGGEVINAIANKGDAIYEAIADGPRAGKNILDENVVGLTKFFTRQFVDMDKIIPLVGLATNLSAVAEQVIMDDRIQETNFPEMAMDAREGLNIIEEMFLDSGKQNAPTDSAYSFTPYWSGILNTYLQLWDGDPMYRKNQDKYFETELDGRKVMVSRTERIFYRSSRRKQIQRELVAAFGSILIDPIILKNNTNRLIKQYYGDDYAKLDPALNAKNIEISEEFNAKWQKIREDFDKFINWEKSSKESEDFETLIAAGFHKVNQETWKLLKDNVKEANKNRKPIIEELPLRLEIPSKDGDEEVLPFNNQDVINVFYSQLVVEQQQKDASSSPRNAISIPVIWMTDKNGRGWLAKAEKIAENGKTAVRRQSDWFKLDTTIRTADGNYDFLAKDFFEKCMKKPEKK